LTVSGGPFMLKSFDYTNRTVTLIRNPKYNTGPAMQKTNPVNQVVFKYVQDGTPAVQALQNGDVDVYQGSPGAAGYSTLQALSSGSNAPITLKGGGSATYEHFDLRTNDGPGTSDHYTGPFADKWGQKAKDLRTAFLLALPRYDMMKTQLQIFNPSAKLLNTNFTLTGSPYYGGITKDNGITSTHTIYLDNQPCPTKKLPNKTCDNVKFTYNYNVTSDKQQAANEALALKLVQKWYPSASKTNSVVDINLLRSSRQMRIDNNALIVAHEANAGFSVSNKTTSGWSSKLSLNDYDAEEFAWVLNSITQDGSVANYLTAGGNNHMGWSDDTVDSNLLQLQNQLSNADIIKYSAAAEAQITANAWTLPIYQWPAITAFNSAVTGVQGSPVSPTAVWNYWMWHF
jgi:peptide/nickel transport system substrate-binding protein